MAEMRAESERYRAENTELRHELQTTRGTVDSLGRFAPDCRAASGFLSDGITRATMIPRLPNPAKPNRTASLEDRVASLEESTQLVNSKVDDQYQTKVESASKYRVRLSGIVLLNLFSNHGATDNQDFPSYVTGSSAGTGNFGATMRQSEIWSGSVWSHLGGGENFGKLAGRFRRWISRDVERRRLRHFPFAHGQHAHGLEKYFAGRGPGQRIFFAAHANVVCVARGARA